MGLISLQFALFISITMLVYFLCPKKVQWMVLLVASYAYYLLICNKYILYMLVTTVTTWYGGICISKLYEKQKADLKLHKGDWDRAAKKAYKQTILTRCRRIMIAVLLLNFGILGFLKYFGWTLGLFENLAGLFGMQLHLPDPGFLLPLGISFYTFQAMGYIIDVYQETVEAEKKLARFALFVSFFPQIIQGPIALYSDLAHQLYEPHEFDFDRLKSGFALILWGMFKKMVIADRAVKLISFVTEDSAQFSGTVILVTALIYALQLYADFSGGIDMVRGIAEILGIDMAENFKRPYFSTSLTEYWHRWHMTLGNWVRTYVFYPLSISKPFLNMNRKMTALWGKHFGKVIPTSLASVLTFLIIGIWHGANGKYVAFGLWNGLAIMIMELCNPLQIRVEDKLHINREGKLYHLAAILWTFLLVLIGYYFDIARNCGDAINMMVRSVADFHPAELLSNPAYTDCGLSRLDYLPIFGGMLVIFLASVIQEKSGDTIRHRLFLHHELLQAVFLLAAMAVIGIFGYYGPGYDAAAFVYMQF